MKKSILFFVALAGLTTMSSCGNKAASTLETAADSASYALGVANGMHLGEAMRSGMYAELQNVDAKEFMSGFVAAFKTDSSQHSYDLGLSQGLYAKNAITNIKDRYDVEIDIPTFIHAYQKSLEGDTTVLIKGESANQLLNTIFMAAAQAKEEKELARLAESPEAKENLAKGEAFLAEKAKEPGVQKTESGLLYKVVKAGTGETVKENQRAKISYKGSLIDGNVFDSNKSATFSPRQVVKGFGEGLQLMQKGGQYTLYIPAELGYGLRSGSDKIPANSVLIFDVEVLDVI